MDKNNEFEQEKNQYRIDEEHNMNKIKIELKRNNYNQTINIKSRSIINDKLRNPKGKVH